MQPTLQDGQWIIAIRSQISPGDVAIFYNPHTQSLNVKRYIMDSLQSPNIQNGWLITPWGKWFLSEEQWEYVEKSYNEIIRNTFSSEALKPEHFFFVGDNQFQSYDSRDFGYISRSRLIGRVLLGWHDVF